jgi:FOG: WD40 repeat
MTDRICNQNRPAEQKYKYWAFISYSHANETEATWLQRTLERYSVPRALVGKQTDVGPLPKKLFPVFRDRDELSAAGSLPETIDAALQQSRTMIVVCSPHAARSRYVDEEIRTFKRIGRGHRIFCLIIDGEPGASLNPEIELAEAFPRSLLFEFDADGRQTERRAEPLAADMRPKKDGKDNARLKLIAGILGVGFDDLKRRELRRRRWQMGQVAVLCAMIGATVAGVWYRQGLETKKQRAFDEARQAATTSLATPASTPDERLRLALQSVDMAYDPYGVLLPEAEVALYRSLTDSGLRAVSFEPKGDSEFAGGWYWPATFSADGEQIIIPSIYPTLVLDGSAQELRRLTDPEIPYHNDYSATFIGDTLRALTGGNDGYVRFWAEDGRLDRRLRAHTSDVLVTQLSPDGTMLLTAGCDEGAHTGCKRRTARLWQNSGELISELSHGGENVTSATFSADGTRIVTADASGKFRLWDPSATLLAEIEAGSSWVSPGAISNDGKWLVTGSCPPYLHAGMFSPVPFDSCAKSHDDAQAEVHLYDSEGRQRATFPGRIAAIAPTGDLIVTARSDCRVGKGCQGEVRLFATDGARLETVNTGTEITYLGFDRSGQSIVVIGTSGSDETGTMTILDRFGTLVSVLGGFPRHLTSASFSPDGNRLVSPGCPRSAQRACISHAFYIWDPNGALTRQYRTAYPAVSPAHRDRASPFLAASPSGEYVLIASNDGGRPGLWRSDSGDFSPVSEAGGEVRYTRFDEREEQALVQGAYPGARGAPDKEWLLLVNTASSRLVAPAIPLKDTKIAASTHYVVFGRPNGTISFFHWSGGKLQATAQSFQFDAPIASLAAAASDDRFAVLDEQGRGKLLNAHLEAIADVDAASLNQAPEGKWSNRRRDTTVRAHFTPDGARLVVAGPGNISVWDHAGSPLWNLDIDRSDDTDVHVRNDVLEMIRCTERGRGATLGSSISCYNSRATLIDMSNGEEILLDPGIPGDLLVQTMQRNALGNRVATVEKDGTARLWNAAGQLLTTLPLPVRAAIFDPRDNRLLTLGRGNMLQDWETWEDLEAMRTEARRRIETVAMSPRSAP